MIVFGPGGSLRVEWGHFQQPPGRFLQRGRAMADSASERMWMAIAVVSLMLLVAGGIAAGTMLKQTRERLHAAEKRAEAAEAAVMLRELDDLMHESRPIEP